MKSFRKFGKDPELERLVVELLAAAKRCLEHIVARETRKAAGAEDGPEDTNISR